MKHRKLKKSAIAIIVALAALLVLLVFKIAMPNKNNDSGAGANAGSNDGASGIIESEGDLEVLVPEDEETFGE